MSDFAKGVCAGITAFAIGIHLWLGVMLEDMRGMYRDLGDAHLPVTTQIVFSPAWRWLVPALGLGALTWLVLRRPVKAAPYVIVAALLVMTAVATYQLANAPLAQLAVRIKD